MEYGLDSKPNNKVISIDEQRKIKEKREHSEALKRVNKQAEKLNW